MGPHMHMLRNKLWVGCHRRHCPMQELTRRLQGQLPRSWEPYSQCLSIPALGSGADANPSTACASHVLVSGPSVTLGASGAGVVEKGYEEQEEEEELGEEISQVRALVACDTTVLSGGEYCHSSCASTTAAHSLLPSLSLALCCPSLCAAGPGAGGPGQRSPPQC